LIAEKNYAEAYRSLAHSLRQSYMDLVARKLKLRAERYLFRLAEDELKLARGNLERGTVPPGAVAGKELDVNEHRVRLATEEEEFAAALRSFARIAGLKELREESIPDELPSPAYSPAHAKTILAEFLRQGGRFTFQAEVSALQAQEADLNYRIARVRLLPKFDAAASQSLQNVTTAGPGTVGQTGVSYQTLMVRMNWAIFDGLEARGRKRHWLANRELHERRAQVAMDAALERAQQLERRLALDAQMMEYADQRLGIAVLGEQQQRDEFKLGNAPETGIQAATASRYQWEARSANARVNFLARWSEFVSLAGLDPVINHLPSRYVRESR
jgi:outer membrane protein TolC